MTAVAQSTDRREFPFSAEDFRFLASLVHETTGIVLADHKANMVYSRLVRRLRDLRLQSFQAYCQILRGPGRDEELGTFINAITTNLTRFFREPHHFEHLASEVLGKLPRNERRLRIWSAGCSSGEEPYTIAMTMAEALPALGALDARILATDLDTNMVARAAAGIYSNASLEDLAPAHRERWMTEEGDRSGARVRQSLRDMITFKKLNLLASWPMQGPFDVIFCRNVMIYFDNPTKEELVQRFADYLRPGGWLYIGHSETLLDQRDIFAPAGRTIYRRIG